MFYQTDVKCTQKNEFAYFIKIDGKFFCIATTRKFGRWELTETSEFDKIDLIELTEKQFFLKKHYGLCELKGEVLKDDFIKSIIK